MGVVKGRKVGSRSRTIKIYHLYLTLNRRKVHTQRGIIRSTADRVLAAKEFCSFEWFLFKPQTWYINEILKAYQSNSKRCKCYCSMRLTKLSNNTLTTCDYYHLPINNLTIDDFTSVDTIISILSPRKSHHDFTTT